MRGINTEKSTLRLSKKKGVNLMLNWIKDRVKEMSSWSGATLIAFGLLIVLGGPFVKIAAYAAIVWGIISICKKD